MQTGTVETALTFQMPKLWKQKEHSLSSKVLANRSGIVDYPSCSILVHKNLKKEGESVDESS